MAINREPVCLLELRDNIISPNAHAQLIDDLESLTRRSVIEKASLLEKIACRLDEDKLVIGTDDHFECLVAVLETEPT